MEIKNGSKKIKVKFKTLTSIAEISCSNSYIIYIFKGTLSPNDILLKYSSPKNKILRTPKHIHWAVDLLLKKNGDVDKTDMFLTKLNNYWNECTSLIDNSYISILNIFNNLLFDNSFNSLNNYGEYPVDFLYTLLCFLAIQEKTNALFGGTTAHMFNDVILELKKNDLDIFKIISTAGFNGR